MGKKSRVFLRGMSSEQYGLREFREAQLAAPRVRNDEVVVDDAAVGHSGDSEDSRTWWRIGPGDEPFLTQNIQVHFVEIPPGKANHGHGHQNEAAFYILQGSGYEIHDDQRYDWAAGDVVAVHTDSVHRHFNDGDETAKALVMKAKSTWMYFGLIQQGRSGPVENEERFGPREEWGQVWTPGVAERKKVMKPADAVWETTRDGKVRVRVDESTGSRVFSVDIYEQEVPAGSRSAKHWHMADEVVYVLSGQGYSLQWEVEAEIAEKYYARIAKEPTRWDFKTDDTVYVPQNHVHQWFNASETEPLVLLSCQNRLVKHLGYDKVVYLEDAPEYAGAGATVGATA